MFISRRHCGEEQGERKARRKGGRTSRIAGRSGEARRKEGRREKEKRSVRGLCKQRRCAGKNAIKNRTKKERKKERKTDRKEIR